MTLCCIGGVCIPYSALLPVAVWCLQWLVEKLGLKSYIPDSWWNLLQSKKEQKKNKSLLEGKQPSCCSTVACTPDSSVHDNDATSNSSQVGTGTGLVRSIDSENEWEQLLLASKDKSKGVVVMAKFTATWCRPCHAIQPVYEALAAAAADNKSVIFGTIDVDELDAVASDLKVAILPTVVVVKGGVVVDRYTGSHAGQLQDFCNRHTGTSQ
jgi:thiol-disulfide isomerase/thioredoxin